MICIIQIRFRISHDCVQLLEDWQLLRLPAPHDFEDVLAASHGSGPEAGQAIREDRAARRHPLL